MNNVSLVGRLTRDPELKYTANNVANATFSIAVNRRFKNAQGEREADFINCVIWRQQAENFANWLRKGMQVSIVGSIQTRNYENNEGRRVYVTEILVDNFQSLERRDASQEMQQQVNNGMQQQGSYNPNQGQNFARDPLAGQAMEINPDDLPF